MYYVQYLQQQLRELRIRMYVVYSRTCDMYSSNSCDGAAHVLSKLLRTIVLRTVSTAAAAVVLPFYAATPWAVGHRITVYVLPEFYKQTETVS